MPAERSVVRRFSFRNGRVRFHSGTLSRSHAPEKYGTSWELWVNDWEARIFVGVASHTGDHSLVTWLPCNRVVSRT